MSLFGRRTSQPPPPGPAPSLPEGRLLRTSAAPEAAARFLEEALSRLRERRYPELPFLVPAGWTWLGSVNDHPDFAQAGSNQEGNFLFAAFRGVPDGTVVGLVPLNPGDEQVAIGTWKQADPSLTSIGRFPAAVVRLTAPPVPKGMFEELVLRGGYPATEHNLHVIEEVVTRQVLVKASQFLGQVDERRAQSFVDARRRPPVGSTAQVQRILDDLVVAEPAVAPWIQDLPARIRAILLQAAGERGTVWETLERP